MREYHDYAVLINGGSALSALVTAPTHLQLAGVPDLQMEVFDPIAGQFDCQNRATLPLGPGGSHIPAATPEFMSKYLLMLVVLLAAADSDVRRRQFFNMATSALGATRRPIVGSDVIIRELVDVIARSTDHQVQTWLQFKAGKCRHGKKVRSAAKYIQRVAATTAVPPPIGGPNALESQIFGMGPKTTRLYYRWMCQPPPDLGVWPLTTPGQEIPVDTRILESCRESLAVVPGANTPRWQNAFSGKIKPSTFTEVTEYVKTVLKFGPAFMQVDYPFWLLARVPKGQQLPGCYVRIHSLGVVCPLAKFGIPRCKTSGCPFMTHNFNNLNRG